MSVMKLRRELVFGEGCSSGVLGDMCACGYLINGDGKHLRDGRDTSILHEVAYRLLATIRHIFDIPNHHRVLRVVRSYPHPYL